MKKIFPLYFLLIISTVTFSQQNNPTSTLTKQDYLKKSKTQKTVGWILMGAGIVSTGLGSVQVNPNYGSNTNRNGLLIAGLAAIGTSIPLFIASVKNRRKATSLSFQIHQIPQLQQTSIVYYPIPSLRLKINL